MASPFLFIIILEKCKVSYLYASSFFMPLPMK